MIFETFQRNAETFLYRKEIAKNAELLMVALKELRDLVPAQGKIWLETPPNHLYVNSLEQATIILNLLTEKKAPGSSVQFPLGDYIHPTMLYRMSAHFDADGQPKDFEFVPPQPDRKDLAFKKMGPFLKKILLGTTKPNIQRFHFPPQPDETPQFVRLMPLMLVELHHCIALLRENMATAKVTSVI